MTGLSKWDWETKEKLVADINEWKEKYPVIGELVVSDDGEKIATVAQTEDTMFTTCVNGEAWEENFNRVWSLKFNSDNQLLCIVYKDFEWAVVIDKEILEGKYDFIYNLQLTNDGKGVAFDFKKEESYGVSFNGHTWENMFFDARDLIISPDGKRAASRVQIKRLAASDIFTFKEGIWTIAVDGNPWDKTFWSVLSGIVFSPDSNHVAAAVRTAMAQYTIAVDGKPWEGAFGLVWEPIFKPGSNDVIAPIRTPKGTTLAMNGKPIWGFFYNVWRQKFSPDGQKIAAVVCSPFSRWTIAVDGNPWKFTVNEAVLSPVFSPDSKRVAAVVKDKNRWTIAVDGSPWHEKFDNVWDPIFSPSGDKVVAKAERNGKYFVVVDGKIGKKGYEHLWTPVFSPDGEKLLIRCVEDGKYYRRVVPISEL